MHQEELIGRIERLERANRRLGLIALATPILLVLGGWVGSQQGFEVIKTNRLEIVDAKGVPMVTLSTGRSDEGGSIVLRDKLGERRGWWTVNANGGSLGLAREAGANEDGAATAGLSVTQTSAELNLLGAKSAMLSASVREEKPRLDLWDSNGKSLFGAPWSSGTTKP